MIDKDHFKNIIEDLNDGIVLFDSKGQIRELNEKAKLLLNLRNDAIGANLISHLGSNFKNEADLMSAIMGTGITEVNVTRPENENYNALYLSLKIVKTLTDGTNVMVIRDETEKHMQSLLQNEFLTMISHKLRTPVVALSYAMNLVLKRKELQFSEKESDDFIEQSYYKSFEISEVIEKLIRFATVIKDHQYSREDTTDLGEILDEVIEKYEKKYKKIRLPHVFEIKKLSPNLVLKMPQDYVFLILECLIDNAVKFNNKENSKITITLGPSENNRLNVTIDDCGSGIPQEFQERIFENFFQVDKYCTGTVEGVGLGLPLVRQVLKTYGQSIKVESSVDKGAKFTLTLPQ